MKRSWLPLLAKRWVNLSLTGYRSGVSPCSRPPLPYRVSLGAWRPAPASYSTSTAAHSLGDCRGCGAPFQKDDPEKPGFLSDRREPIPIQRKQSRTMSHEEYEAALEALDPETRALLEGGESLDGDTVEDSENAVPKKEATKKESARTVCERCYALHHRSHSTTDVSPEFLRKSQQLSSLAFLRTKRDPLIVAVLDMTDLPFSLGDKLPELIRQNPGARIIVAANKYDLIPDRARPHAQRLQDWILQHLKFQGISTKRIQGIHLVSAKKGWGLPALMKRIQQERLPTDDVYLVGCTNVGKSALVNRLLAQTTPTNPGGSTSAAQLEEARARKAQIRSQYAVTSSALPGTTMGMVKIPLHVLGLSGPRSQDWSERRFVTRERYLIDTPGIVNDQQLIHRLPVAEQMVLMKGALQPVTFRLNKGQSLLLTRHVRVDVVESSSPVLVTLFTHVAPHITKTFKLPLPESGDVVDSSNPCDSTLQPMPHLVKVQGIHRSHASVDFAFSSLGWFAVAGLFDEAKFRIWLPKDIAGHAFALREPPMLPFEYRGSIRKFFGSGERARK